MKNNKKTITMGLTALMCLGSTSSFWDLPTSELDKIALNPLSVTVYAATLPQFKDQIPDWASSDISYLVGKGIIKGYEDNTFRANGTMTRLEFLTAVVRSLKTDSEIDSLIAEAKQTDLYDTGSTYGYYEDKVNDALKQGNTGKTADNFWGTRYIIAAYLLHLTEGNGTYFTYIMIGNEIGWNQPVSRQEAATLMYNACTTIRGESLPASKGIHNIISDYSNIEIDRCNAIEGLVSNGLIAGVDDNFTFAPKQNLSRAQACAIIARITDTSRRLSKPVVPEDKQEWINGDVERDITYHNPVTGQDETRDINDWGRILHRPSYNGTIDGEYSKDGYYQWDAGMGMWGKLVAF